MAELANLNGRAFAITGASRGMGLRFARALAAEGAKIALIARPSNALDAAAKEIVGSIAAPCDVTSSSAVRGAFAAIEREFGCLHGLINNAGACLIHKVAQSTDEEFRQEIDTNLTGPLFCIREAIPLLKASGGGDIVNVSSESVRLPFPYLTVYAATKAALETLSHGLRAELRPDGIRVTILRSGHVADSSLGASWDPKRTEAFYATAQASGRLQFSGEAVAPETMALMLVQMLKLPREANLDLIELRAF